MSFNTLTSKTQPIRPRVLRRLLAVAIALALELLVVPCSTSSLSANELFKSPEASTTQSSRERQTRNGSYTRQSLVEQPGNAGEIRVRYELRKRFRKARHSIAVLAGQRTVEQIVDQLNRHIALEFDVNVLFAECDDDSAYYDRNSKQIAICYQTLDRFYDLFSRKLKGETARYEATEGATVSLFLHELGHALIDVGNLPITGKEEDAADQFATLLMLNGIKEGERMALSGALTFKLYAQEEKGRNKLYWDSHSLDEQRFYNTMCLIYGHKPEAYEYLIRNGTLPIPRALNCEDDYPRVKRAWQTLLSPLSKSAPSIFVKHRPLLIPTKVTNNQ